MSRKFVKVLVCITLAFSCLMITPCIAKAAEKPKVSDVNGDGKLDVLDYALLRRYIAGSSAVREKNKVIEYNADYNYDGQVDFFDLVILKSMI